MEIAWPDGGTHQLASDLPLDRAVEITEVETASESWTGHACKDSNIARSGSGATPISTDMDRLLIDHSILEIYAYITSTIG